MSTPGGPQDRLPNESGTARFEMPTVADAVAGRVAPAQPGAVEGQAVQPYDPAQPALRVTGARGQGSIIAIFSDQKREGHWVLGAKTPVTCVFGDVTLDLRGAELEAAEVVLDTWTLFGDVTVIVPPGVRVVSSVAAVLADHKQKMPLAPPPDAPTVTLRGGALFADVTVLQLAPGEKPPRFLDRLFGR